MLFGPPPEEPAAGLQPTEQTCPNCGAQNAAGFRFCVNCGRALPAAAGRFCTRCGTQLDPSFRFCTNCGLDVSAITGAAYVPAPGSYPVTFEVEYPEKLSRLLIFVKLILAIPQYLVVYALGSVISVVTFIVWFAILFTGRYPLGLFNLVVGFTRWSANVSVYTGFMRDEYPPFTMDPGKYPVTYDVQYPERLSRWLIFFKLLLVIPNQLVVGLLGFVSFFVTFISWWAILFTGRFPRGLFDFNVGVLRWGYRATAYANLQRDEYPPYSLRSDAKPSGWKAIVIGIIVGILALIGMIAAVAAFLTIDAETETVQVSITRLESGNPAEPVRVEGTRVLLTGVEDPYDAFANPDAGNRLIAFEMTITNVDALFSSVGRDAFELEDSFGDEHRPIEDPLNFTELTEGEQAEVVVVFEIDESAEPVSLTYAPGFAAYLPIGEKVRFEFE
jgi:hypothetical protein